MKALSLWQPWASACFFEVDGSIVKRIETRHWYTRVRGPLIIHAAKKWDGDLRDTAEMGQRTGELPDEIPLGVLLGTVNLVEVSRAESLRGGISDRERRWGNYGDGRYGFVFRDQRPLPRPIPYKGAQGFFDVPDGVLSGEIIIPRAEPTTDAVSRQRAEPAIEAPPRQGSLW